jgi:predicted HTH domain antitoxin
MAVLTIEIPDDAFSALRLSPKEFAREMRLAAAIHWYSRELVSQGKAAEIAGVSRRDFLEALYRARAPACQATIEDIAEELKSWPASSDESPTPRR